MKILYATDGSEGGIIAARFLASLPPGKDIRIHIVTVLDSNDPNDGKAILDTAAKALGDFPARVTTEAGRGGSTSEVVDVLLSIADAFDADLIAVGASGQSAVARFFLGSVAESVARHARQPVLVTRPLKSPLHEVIIGVDGSACAHAAAEFAAVRFPLPSSSTLRLVSVITQPIFGVAGDPSYPDTADYRTLESANRESRKNAQMKAEDYAEKLRAGTQRTITVEPVVLGNPAVELVRLVNEQGAGLLVVGSQGLTGIERFLLGSVSERVLHHAPCSVLIVKAPKVDNVPRTFSAT